MSPWCNSVFRFSSRAHSSRKITMNSTATVSENAFENSNGIPTARPLLLPLPLHSCNARYVCEDRSYVCTRNVSRLDEKEKRLIFHSLRRTFSYWVSPFNISFVEILRRDFVLRLLLERFILLLVRGWWNLVDFRGSSRGGRVTCRFT